MRVGSLTCNLFPSAILCPSVDSQNNAAYELQTRPSLSLLEDLSLNRFASSKMLNHAIKVISRTLPCGYLLEIAYLHRTPLFLIVRHMTSVILYDLLSELGYPLSLARDTTES
ncbi:hypothetical protein A0H81_12633 [Grifola frondosa]|uniref:Uncharacterized protein n=1 Tax=Grifola frondosa TaxID=5627 RepID=A0A1C7LR66_GRIFR|nr:hypothetical protein A0H81_12633 [Grifola frondosa]